MSQVDAGNAAAKKNPVSHDLRGGKDVSFTVVALRCWICYSGYKLDSISPSLYFLICKMEQSILVGRIK